MTYLTVLFWADTKASRSAEDRQVIGPISHNKGDKKSVDRTQAATAYPVWIDDDDRGCQMVFLPPQDESIIKTDDVRVDRPKWQAGSMAYFADMSHAGLADTGSYRIKSLLKSTHSSIARGFGNPVATPVPVK